jgi:hypothetical protein
MGKMMVSESLPLLSTSFSSSCCAQHIVVHYALLWENMWVLRMQTVDKGFFVVPWGGVTLSPHGTSASTWPIVPALDDDDDNDEEYECGAVTMKIGRGNRSTQRRLAPVSLCPPQIPHNLTWAWTQAAMVGSWRLNAWSMAQSLDKVYSVCVCVCV